VTGNIYRARQIEDRSKKRYIIKRTRSTSLEIEILQQLNTSHPRCDQIIELITVIDKRWIVLPEHCEVAGLPLSVSFGLVPKQRLVHFSRELAKGLSFLHDNGIAHLDIKPDNLVYTQDNQLKIIDFDASVRVRNEDETISGYIGSDDYMAPEIGPMSGPHPEYSPIKADRYSCGMVMKWLAMLFERDDNEGLLNFANRLTNPIPDERPRLLEWHGVDVGMKDSTDIQMNSKSSAERLVGEQVKDGKWVESGRPQKKIRTD
jgi:serine/threonine protein kinase